MTTIRTTRLCRKPTAEYRDASAQPCNSNKCDLVSQPYENVRELTE